nr:phosphatase PAP2 family protein [Rhodococcus sp. HNM0569]
MHFEQWLHIDVEKALNEWMEPHALLTVLANYEYAFTYVLSAFLLLAWLYVKHPDDYRRARSSFIVLNLLSIACFALFPVTPPRLLPELGYVDTVAQGATVGSWGSPLVSHANQLAAMPSLHVAWALWVSVVLARLSRGITVQIVSAIHVAITVLVIVVTANHYLVDAVAAVPFVWASVALVDWHHGRRRAARVPSADAFFLHVESDTAPQHVGGMVVLAPTGTGSPTVDEVRAHVRDQLGNLPRFTQQLAPLTTWRRPRWVAADDIDWTWHVTERTATDPGEKNGVEHASAALSRAIADLAAERLPLDRPLWRIVLVREISPGRTGLAFLVHHCVADGIGTVVQAMELLRPRIELPSGHAGPGALKTAAATVAGLAQLATDGKPAAKLPPGSAARGFSTAALDLASVRAIAKSNGARVTDVVLTVVAEAVERTHPEFAESSLRGKMRASVPIMLREPDSAAEGNVTAAVMLDLPLGDMPVRERLARISRVSTRLRTPTRALASRFVMAHVLAALPVPVQRWFARTVYGPSFLQAVVSNMPGPTVPMTFMDAPLDRVVPILPLAPDAPLALGALSWNGELGIGLAVDGHVLDATALTAAMSDVVDALADEGAQAGVGYSGPHSSASNMRALSRGESSAEPKYLRN